MSICLENEGSTKQLSYTVFQKKVMDALSAHYQGTRQVSFTSVIRNNTVKLDGIMIRDYEKRAAPTFYLNEYYKEYLKGVDLQEIVRFIIRKEQSEWNNHAGSLSEFTFRWDMLRDKVTYRLVNRKMNESFLAEAPHEEFLDLSVIYQCIVDTKGQNVGTIRITNEHMKQLGITQEELKKAADENSRKLMPPKFVTMEEVLRRMIDKCEEVDAFTADFRRNPQMYVLSDASGVFGATVLLYHEELLRIRKLLRCNFYVLPSSVHEVIVIPEYPKIVAQEMAMMVHEINHSQVAEEEILSDSVYYVQEDAVLMVAE